MTQTLVTTRFDIDSSLEYKAPWRESASPQEFLRSVKRSSRNNSNVEDLYSSQIDADYLHVGYYSYLQHCWSTHSIAVISPEIIWQILMSVTSERVCANPELYRDTFTRHKDKVKLTVHGSIGALPEFATDIANMIVMSAPEDISLLTPEFSTATPMSRMAQAVALMDTASPYYDYCMMCCGLPAVEVRGTEADWKLLNESWNYLKQLLYADASNLDWLNRAHATMENVIQNWSKAETWQNFFTCERCGSGSDVTLGGWITRLAFVIKNGFTPVHTMPTAIANADFEELSTGKHYRIFSGILGSKTTDGLAEPVFGYMLANMAS